MRRCLRELHQTAENDRAAGPTYRADGRTSRFEALLLEDVRRPARGARAREHRRRELRRDVRDVEDDRRPELDVRREHAVGLARVELRERHALELVRDLEARRAELLRGAPEEPRPRILGAVDAMPEAHQPVAAVEQILDEALHRRRGGGGIEHRQHARGGAAVERARERPDRGRQRGRAVGPGRGDDPRREGRGVETVLGGADPVRVDRLDVLRVCLSPPLEQEPLRGRLALGDDRGVDAIGVPVGEARGLRADRDHRGREPAQVLLRLVVRDVDQLLEPPLAAEARGDRLEVGRRLPREVARGVVLRGRQTGLGRLVDEEAPDLLERHRPDELLDVDAAVAERAAVAIRLGDLGLEGDDALEARLELGHRAPLRSVSGVRRTVPTGRARECHYPPPRCRTR